jgi:hypothetical protein
LVNLLIKGTTNQSPFFFISEEDLFLFRANSYTSYSWGIADLALTENGVDFPIGG